MLPMEHLVKLIEYMGYFGYGFLFLIIFFESFPLTFFLPGDSLLFTAGFLASRGYFNLALLVTILFIASVLGYFFSYIMGEKIRDFILKSNDKYWFKKKHIEYTNNFYKKYGDRTLIIGRFIPIVRSFSPTLAGTVDMNYKKFIRDTLIGGILWTGGVTSIGFYFGNILPNSKILITPIILTIIFISLLPALIEFIKHKRNKRTQHKTS